MRGTSLVLLSLLAMLAWSRPAHAAESYANCTGVVSALPTTISTPGTYCLQQNLTSAATTGNLIEIATDNVTLDCNDFTLTGTGGTGTTAVGVHALGRFNAVVRHCNVSGVQYGAYLQGANGGGHVVEDNRFHADTYVGVRVEGDGSVVRRNQVYDNGGSTAGASAYGIYTNASVNVTGNTVSGVNARVGGHGSAYGIYTNANASGAIVDNHISELAKDGAGRNFGIFNVASGRVTMRGNDVFGDKSANSVGLSCSSANGHAKDNIIGGFITALQTCSDGGDNDIAP